MVSRVSHTTINADNAFELASWWKRVLDYVDVDGDPNQPGDDECMIVAPDGDHRLLFLEVDELHGPDGRIHLDLTPTDHGRDEEVERVVALGARVVADRRDPDGTGWVVLADPAGNRFCILRSDDERRAHQLRANQSAGPLPVRAGTPGDASVLRALYRRSASTNDSGRRAFAARPELAEPSDEDLDAGRVRVASQGGRIVGFAVTVPTEEGTAELDALFVDPDTMGRGVGRALVTEAAARARATGVQRLDVVAAPEAVAFYRRCGFEGRGPTSTEFGPAELLSLQLDR